jgi:hypothetical protein
VAIYRKSAGETRRTAADLDALIERAMKLSSSAARDR